MIRKITGIVVVLLATQSSTYAIDIVREISQTGPGSGSYAEVSLTLSANRLPLVGFNDQDLDESDEQSGNLSLVLDGRLEYRNFFAEFITESFNNATFGYNALSTEKFSLDLIGTQMFESISRNDDPSLASIENRDGDFNLGLRGNFFSGDNIVQAELVRDVDGAHEGVIASLQYGRQYQVRNWNLYSLAGIRYFSRNAIDHYFGVSEQEATDSLPVYDADDGFLPSLLLGAAIPITEKWIFRASVEYAYLPESVRDSPLAQGDDFYIAKIGISRVLYPW